MEIPPAFLQKLRRYSLTTYLLSLLLLVIFIVIRWRGLFAPFERDEGEYAYNAFLLLHHLSPYQYSFLQKPPMIIYTYLLAQVISPALILPIRIIAAFFELGTIVCVGIIVRKEETYTAAWLAMFATTILLATPFLLFHTANTEKFMILPMMIVVCIFTYHKRIVAWQGASLSGVCAALSILYKPLSLLPLATVYLVWSLLIWRSKQKFWQVVVFLTWSGIGAFCVSFLCLFYFLRNGTLPKLYEEIVAYNRYYIANHTIGVPPLGTALYLTLLWLPLILFAVGNIFLRIKRYWSYYAFIAAAMFSLSQAKFPHYFYLLVPFLGVLIGLAFSPISQRLGTFAGRRVAFIMTLIFFVTAISYTEWLFLTIQVLPSNSLPPVLYGGTNDFVNAIPTASVVMKLTTQNDYVFAGSEPEINYYAKRLSPTRFNITSPLQLTTIVRGQYQHEFMHAIMRNPPKIIVLPLVNNNGYIITNKNDAFEQSFEEFLGQRYAPIYCCTRGTQQLWSKTNSGQATYIIYILQTLSPISHTGQ